MKLPKHHYIPVFYLREWVDSKNRLMEFSRPTGKEVKARDTAPTGTGLSAASNLFEAVGPIDLDGSIAVAARPDRGEVYNLLKPLRARHRSALGSSDRRA